MLLSRQKHDFRLHEAYYKEEWVFRPQIYGTEYSPGPYLTDGRDEDEMVDVLKKYFQKKYLGVE